MLHYAPPCSVRLRTRRQGLTLAEILLAFVVLLTVTLIAMRIFTGGLNQLFESRGKSTALHLCCEKLEAFLRCPQDTLVSGSGRFEGRLQRFSWTVTVDPPKDGLRRIQVAVRGSPREVATQSVRRATPMGRIVYAQVGTSGREELYACRPDGSRVERLTDGRARHAQPALSPDGKKVAFVADRGGAPQIHVRDLVAGRTTPLTRHTGGAHSPAWAPDSRHLAYVATDGGHSQIFITAITSGGYRLVSHSKDHHALSPCFSGDGMRLCWVTTGRGSLDLVVANQDGSDAERITQGGGIHMAPAWSPDGKSIAFVSTRDGMPQLYLMDPRGKEIHRLTRTGASGAPSWSPNGGQLAFANDSSGSTTLCIINRDGTGQRRIFRRTLAVARMPSWGPLSLDPNLK